MKIFDIPQSGKRGLTVSQNGRYGQISRALVFPSNPQTNAQMNVRSTFASQARRWDAITQAQRTAWIAAAATHQTKPRCGTSGPMTGLQFFVQVNANLALLGQDTVDTPPVAPTFDALAPQNLVIANAAGAITLKLTCPTSPGANTVVEATAPVNPGKEVNGNYRVIGTCPVPVQGPADITSLYVAKFGAPAPGTKVFVSVHQMQDGYTSVAKRFSAIVPAA